MNRKSVLTSVASADIFSERASLPRNSSKSLRDWRWVGLEFCYFSHFSLVNRLQFYDKHIAEVFMVLIEQFGCGFISFFFEKFDENFGSSVNTRLNDRNDS